MLTVLSEIRKRVLEIQKANVLLQERQHQERHHFEKDLDSLFLKLVEIVDMVEYFEGDSINSSSESAVERRVLKKVSRRLNSLFEQFKVNEIQIESDNFKPGEVKVLESQGLSDFKICRKGYRRGGRILRATEVIT